MRIIRDIITTRRNLIVDKPIPLSVAVNITGRCNLKCGFCEKSTNVSNDEIDFQVVKRLVDFAVEHNCPIVMGGGEPFLHKQIWEILRYCRDVRVKVSVLTNGTLFDNLKVEQFELLNDSVDIMSVSLDSVDPAEHDNIRGRKGTFDKVLRFINNPLRKNKIGLNSVLDMELKNVQSMIEFAKRTRCSVNFLPLIFESNFPELSRLEWKRNIQKDLFFPAERIEKLKYFNGVAKKLGVATNLPLIHKFIYEYFQYANTDQYFTDYVLNKFMCFIPFQQLTVNEKGLIIPCTFLQGDSPSVSEGDIYKNWLEIALKYRQLLKAGKRFGVCRSCTCHFADNCRSSIITYPFKNRNQLLWMVTYYFKRLLQGEGRK